MRLKKSLKHTSVNVPVRAGTLCVVPSKDGTPVSYEIFGTGDPLLVFVHGWNGDSRYWRAQIPYFSKHYRIVSLDLAGHGHSGTSRSRYTMKSFGEDVHAVTEAINSHNVILIGHSMGGLAIAEAARLMPDRVIGLIGVDTLQNIEQTITRQFFETIMTPMKKDFQTGIRQFAERMFSPDIDPQLKEWLLADLSAASPDVAFSTMEEMMLPCITGELAKVFEEIRAPVITINGDLTPINYEANRRHMIYFDAVVLEGADHFLFMTQPDAFNLLLKSAIDKILKIHRQQDWVLKNTDEP